MFRPLLSNKLFAETLFGFPELPNSKNDTFGLVSKLLERDFVNYRKPYDQL